jgi:cytochrome c-type biogenesis protein CcmH/NrfG
MDIFVLIVAAIFFFAVATLFRSNEAINRVKDVEKELGVIEDEVKEVREHATAVPSEKNESTEAAPHIVLEEVEAPFPDAITIHKESH